MRYDYFYMISNNREIKNCNDVKNLGVALNKLFDIRLCFKKINFIPGMRNALQFLLNLIQFIMEFMSHSVEQQFGKEKFIKLKTVSLD